MSWINQIKSKFNRRKLRNLQKSRTVSHEFVDIDRAKDIGMIVNVTDYNQTDLSNLDRYVSSLTSRGKKICMIELNFQKKSDARLRTTNDSIFINPSKLNWLGHPVPAVENRVKEKQFDILMDFDASDNITSKYILSIANAKTRTGSYQENYEQCYELMVNLTGTDTIDKKIREYDFFLKMLEK